ncbi:MAG: phosphorylase [Alphaproteobacteria bacterium]|nr:phosphorylase [Alphaproteobacteria bacterium]
MTILAVCGLTREAEIAGTDSVIAVAGGGDAAGLRKKLSALHGDMSGVISIGLGGALSPLLKVGDVVIAERIVAQDGNYVCDTSWRVLLAARLVGAHQGALYGSDVVLASAAAKAALFESSGGALAVDMESQIAARFAAERRLPLAALRVISDDASHALPPAALVAMKPDGGIALGRVLWSLAKNPLQLPALIRTGRHSERAFKKLLRCCRLLGPGLGGVNL